MRKFSEIITESFLYVVILASAHWAWISQGWWFVVSIVLFTIAMITFSEYSKYLYRINGK